MKYEDLVGIDLANYAVMQKLKRGIYKPEGDRIVYNATSYNPDIPWIFHGHAEDRDCTRWHKVYFRDYKFIPRECFNCWKIVARPKNLRQLFELNELQEAHALPGKVGVDLRPEAVFKGIFLGFWYCPLGDLEGAREKYKEIKRSVKGALSLDVPVILKRGCTEMENAFGPSKDWVFPEQWRMLQDLLDAVFDVRDLNAKEQPGWIKSHVMRFWIEYAHQRGDGTVKDFVKHYPESLGAVKTVTYDDVVPEIKMLDPREDKENVQAIGIQRLPED